MSFVTKVGGNQTEFELIPTGNHFARCYGLVDLGTQTTNSPMYGVKHNRQIMILFETPKTCMQDGRPFGLNTKYNWSLHEKAKLRKDIESWLLTDLDDGDEFDISRLITEPCMLGVAHTVSNKNGRTYPDIKSISAMPEGVDLPLLFNESIVFSLDEYSRTVFDKLPRWVRKMISDSPEFQKLEPGYVLEGEDQEKPVQATPAPIEATGDVSYTELDDQALDEDQSDMALKAAR